MLPITSSGPNAGGGERAALERVKNDPDAAVAQFEGMLYASALAPLSKELGVLGDVLTSAVGTDIARSSHDEFFRHLRSMAEAAPGSDEGPS